MADSLDEAVHSWVTEAIELRRACSLPPVTASPTEVIQSLTELRPRLDRLEELLGMALRARGKAARLLAGAQGAADDAWDAAVVKQRPGAVAFGGGFGEATAPRERYAEASLQTLDQKRQVRLLEQTKMMLDETVDVLRLHHRGLDQLRLDHHQVRQAISWSQSMESTGRVPT